jgi:NitT/TauT family transport system substrate-binding protein
MAIDNLFDQLKDDKLSRRTVLKIGIATGVGLAGLSAAGCTSPTVTPLPSPSAVPLKSAIPSGFMPSDHSAAIFVAKAKGMFEKYGLNIQLTQFAAGGPIMQQMGAGTLDLGFAGVPPVISAIDNGATVKIVASLQGNGSGIVVGKSSGIAKVADLKGKKIAVPSKGSIQDIMLRQLLKDNNINYDKDVTVSNMPVGQMPQAISAGSIDAAFTWEPYVSMTAMQDLGTVFLRSEQIMRDHPCCCVATSTTMIQQYPDTLKAFFKALKEATDFVLNNPTETAQIISGKDFLNDEAAVEAAALPNIHFIAKPDEQYIAGTEKFALEMNNLGITKKVHDRNDLFDLTLINQVITG